MYGSRITSRINFVSIVGFLRINVKIKITIIIVWFSFRLARNQMFTSMTWLKAHKLGEEEILFMSQSTLHTGRSGSPRLTSKLSHFKSK